MNILRLQHCMLFALISSILPCQTPPSISNIIGVPKSTNLVCNPPQLALPFEFFVFENTKCQSNLTIWMSDNPGTTEEIRWKINVAWPKMGINTQFKDAIISVSRQSYSYRSTESKNKQYQIINYDTTSRVLPKRFFQAFGQKTFENLPMLINAKWIGISDFESPIQIYISMGMSISYMSIWTDEVDFTKNNPAWAQWVKLFTTHIHEMAEWLPKLSPNNYSPEKEVVPVVTPKRPQEGA